MTAAGTGTTTLWKATLPHERLSEAAEAVARALAAAPRPFCLYLQGGLGAGKTTLTGAILRHLGLPEGTPVTSPTFTYMNEYRVGPKWYAHLDLYRAGTDFNLEDLGIVDARPFTGFFVEWPEMVPASPALVPTHVLQIAFAEGGATRAYVLNGKNPGA